MGSLCDGDAAGVEAAQGTGHIAADAADVAAFAAAGDVARIGAVDHHAAVTDNAADTMGGDVGAAADMGDDVRIVDAVADGVATKEVEVLIASGQRRACQAGGAADGVVVAGSGGLDMPLDNAVFDGGAVHQGADGSRHYGGGIRMKVGEGQVAHLTAQHSEKTADIGILVDIRSGIIETEIVDGMAVAEEMTREAAAAEDRADGHPRSLALHVEVGGQLEGDPIRVARHFVAFVGEGFAGVDTVAQCLQVAEVINGEGVVGLGHAAKQGDGLDGVAVQGSRHGDEIAARGLQCRLDGVVGARCVGKRRVNEQAVALGGFPHHAAVAAGQPDAVFHMVDVGDGVGQDDGGAGHFGDVAGPIAGVGPLESRVTAILVNPDVAKRPLDLGRKGLDDDFRGGVEVAVLSIDRHLGVGETISDDYSGDVVRGESVFGVAVIDACSIETESRRVASHARRASVSLLVVVDFAHVEAVLGAAAHAGHPLVAPDVELRVRVLRQCDIAGVEAVTRRGLAGRHHTAEGEDIETGVGNDMYRRIVRIQHALAGDIAGVETVVDGASCAVADTGFVVEKAGHAAKVSAVGGDVAPVVAVGDLRRIVGQKASADHTGEAEFVVLELGPVGGSDVAGVEATGHHVVPRVDDRHHAGHGVLVVCVRLLVCGGDMATVGTVGDPDTISFEIIGQLTYPTYQGTTIFAAEHQVVARDVTVVDGAAHHVGGQCPAVVKSAFEHGVFDGEV